MRTLVFFVFLLQLLATSVTFGQETKKITSNSQFNNNKPVFYGTPDMIEDGDSFWIGIHKVRLYGIDAPESKQMCGNIQCGKKARDFLKNLAAKQAFTCTLHEGKHGKPWIMYGRYVVTCKTGSINVNQQMVKSGWAVASEKNYGEGFRSLETAAAKEGVGIHLTNFVTPKSWRRKQRGSRQCLDNNYIATSSRLLPTSKPPKNHFQDQEDIE